jgi:hypothetical protein
MMETIEQLSNTPEAWKQRAVASYLEQQGFQSFAPSVDRLGKIKNQG